MSVAAAASRKSASAASMLAAAIISALLSGAGGGSSASAHLRGIGSTKMWRHDWQRGEITAASAARIKRRQRRIMRQSAGWRRNNENTASKLYGHQASASKLAWRLNNAGVAARARHRVTSTVRTQQRHIGWRLARASASRLALTALCSINHPRHPYPAAHW